MSGQPISSDLPPIYFGKVGDEKLLSYIHQEAFSQGWRIEQMRESLQNSNNYVIRHGDVAFVMFQLVAGECEVLTIAVLPKFQGKGIARELMFEMLGICATMQIQKAFLEVSTQNLAAIRLYEKFRFVEYNRRTKYYADGSDAILLQLML